jgi:four helix bundle protein
MDFLYKPYFTGQKGSTRFGNKSQANFYQISYSSLMEVVSEIIAAKDLDYIKEKEYIELREKVNELSNKLNSLYNSIKGFN